MRAVLGKTVSAFLILLIIIVLSSSLSAAPPKQSKTEQQIQKPNLFIVIFINVGQPANPFTVAPTIVPVNSGVKRCDVIFILRPSGKD